MIGDCYSICALLSTCLKFLASTILRHGGGPKILKVGYVTLRHHLILYFFVSIKFEVSSFNRSPFSR